MGSAVSPSMALALAGFCFSVIFIVFVCSRLACALLRRRRARRARRGPALPQYAADAAYTFAVHAAAGAGLDPAAVAALPTRAFADSPDDDSDDSQCVICLAEYEEKDVLRTLLPHCGHDFHMACIDLWLEQNTTCPVCRISLLGGNADGEHTGPPPLLSLSVVISPPSSPEPSRSDPCRCLFVSSGHSSSSRASEAAPRHEPDQENQAAAAASASGPSPPDGANNINSTPSSVENISQAAARKQVHDR